MAGRVARVAVQGAGGVMESAGRDVMFRLAVRTVPVPVGRLFVLFAVVVVVVVLSAVRFRQEPRYAEGEVLVGGSGRLLGGGLVVTGGGRR